MRKLLVLVLAALLTLSIALPAASADYVYTRVGQQVTLSAPTTIFTDITLRYQVATLPMGQSCVVVAVNGNYAQVYTLDTHKVGWMPLNNVNVGRTITPAIVLAGNVSLRAAASTSSALLVSIPNGEIVNVLSEYNGWMNVEYLDRRTNTMLVGYIRTEFMQKNPTFVIMWQLTDVYAMPTSGSKKVGQVSSPNALVVIGEMNGYLCVNLRQASGFVRKSDVGW